MSKKRARDLHSQIAYRNRGPKPRTRLVMSIYEQWTGANYGKTKKTEETTNTMTARERAEAAFVAIVTPFEPDPLLNFSQAIIHPKKDKAA